MTNQGLAYFETSAIIGLFMDRASAEHAYQSILAHRYNRNDVSLVMSDATHMRYFSALHRIDSTAAEDRVPEVEDERQSVIGAAVGTIGTALFLPADGLVISGPIASAIASAGAGALSGGLIGALTQSGMPRDRAEDLISGIKRGGILMSVVPHSDDEAARFEVEWSSVDTGLHDQRGIEEALRPAVMVTWKPRKTFRIG